MSIRLDQCISGASKLQKHLKVLVPLFQGTTVGPPKFLPPFLKIGCHEVSEDQKAREVIFSVVLKRIFHASIDDLRRLKRSIFALSLRTASPHDWASSYEQLVPYHSRGARVLSYLRSRIDRSIDLGNRLVKTWFWIVSKKNCQSQRVYVVSGTMIESNGNSWKEVSLFLFLSFCLQWRIEKNEMDSEENVYLSLK